ncbi:MAG: RHS repeat-associated core domain-containing protein, partial [Puia sp.]|nr:RHS repeat-associated core domain-containing protein [Puia sp.]
PLGTRRVQTSSVGQPETDIQSLPFGNQLNSFPDPSAGGTADDSTPLHFTGKERDTESGNDYFGARYYASRMGRWMSPDPLPWLDWQHPSEDASEEEKEESLRKFRDWISNPQHFNLYAYVLNNPLRFTDPDGEEELDKKQVVQIIQNAEKASSNTGQLAANILKALPDNATVSGSTLSAALKDTGVKLDGAVGGALNNATSISKSGDTVTIQSKSATAVNLGGTKVSFAATVSFKVGVTNGNTTLSDIKGVSATKGMTASVTKLELGQSKAVATYKFMGTHTMDIPY